MHEFFSTKTILLVEDEELPRKELKRVLMKRGFRVLEAVNAGHAVKQAEEGNVGLVLMDILLGGGPDGIEAAQQIQAMHPDTSVIFISAYAHEPEYRQRADRIPRVAGWIDKPISAARIQEISHVVSKELIKSHLREWLRNSHDIGKNIPEYLDEIGRQDSLLSSEINQELQQELLNTGPDASQIILLESLEEVEREIDAVQAQIRSLVASRTGESDKAQELLENLRALQEQAGEMMERLRQTYFRFNPDEGERLIERARKLLKKRRAPNSQ